MLFTQQKSTSKFVLNIQGKSIDRTSKAKYLGIIVDDKLRWESHINFVCKKVAHTVARIICNVKKNK